MNSKKLIILHYVNSDVLHDTRLLTQLWASHQYYELHVLCWSGYPKDELEKVLPPGVILHPLLPKKTSKIRRILDLTMVPRIARIVKTIQPDVVHTHRNTSLFLMIALYFLGIRNIAYDIHDMPLLAKDIRNLIRTRQGSWLHLIRILIYVGFVWVLERLFFSIASDLRSFLVVSDPIERYYQSRHPGKQFLVVKNYPPDIFHPEFEFHAEPELPKEKSLSLVYSGQINSINLPREFIETIATFPALTFHIYGDCTKEGSYAAVLKNTCEQKNYSNMVFHGRYNPMTIAADLCRYHIGVLPYQILFENYNFCSPNKLYQYLLAGLPILATNMLETETLIHRFDIGWIYPQENYSQLKELIEELQKNRSLWEEKAQNVSARKSEIMDIQQYKQRLATLYRTIRIPDSIP